MTVPRIEFVAVLESSVVESSDTVLVLESSSVSMQPTKLEKTITIANINADALALI